MLKVIGGSCVYLCGVGEIGETLAGRSDHLRYGAI